MASVCNIFSFMCMREQKKQKVQHRIHPGIQPYDAIVVWNGKESQQKAKQGGISFDIILKEASGSPLVPKPPSPVQRRELSQEQIANKLKKAEERRSLIEAERLEQLQKERQKAIEVLNKAQLENEQFAKKAKEKLRRSMEVRENNRETQIRALQERLREHSLKVHEVQKASEEMVEEFEKKAEEKLSQKMSTYEENRQNQLKSMLSKLKEHASHINEVCAASEQRGPSTDELQEQLVQKMENALKNREDQLKGLQNRLAEHEKRMKEVQSRRISCSGDAISPTK